ncbi:hypothetical protein [Sandarakinorhabdus oryzae]|uniref:hypothetical protein n=1 Tax=Sandarakinorhabdus oryzae TaxID=2675220 RepID=UPI0012E1240A|nr:hypothetical protein [Sandarakinorhabdus oryzae]
MDFIGIIRSLEELLYEVMGWLIFYPRTLWRILIRPDAATRYSEDEQGDSPADRYADSLSPPLLLMITLVLTHALGIGIGMEAPKASGGLGDAVVKSPQNLLMMRAMIFAIIPLVIAGLSLNKRGIAIDRQTLRMPFYSQCFLLTPFALMLQAGLLFYRVPALGPPAAVGLCLAGIAWFLWAQTQWVARRLQKRAASAFGWALVFTLLALLAGTAAALLIALAL